MRMKLKPPMPVVKLGQPPGLDGCTTGGVTGGITGTLDRGRSTWPPNRIVTTNAIASIAATSASIRVSMRGLSAGRLKLSARRPVR